MNSITLSRRSKRLPITTILMIGEGKTDCAFLRHIKSLYISRNCGTSARVKNAHGKGGGHVIDYAIRQHRYLTFDRVIALFDSDEDASPSKRKLAEGHNIQTVCAIPCLEGLLLNILNKQVPHSSTDCKKMLRNELGNLGLSPNDYSEAFPKDFLERRRKHISELDSLLLNFPK